MDHPDRSLDRRYADRAVFIHFTIYFQAFDARESEPLRLATCELATVILPINPSSIPRPETVNGYPWDNGRRLRAMPSPFAKESIDLCWHDVRRQTSTYEIKPPAAIRKSRSVLIEIAPNLNPFFRYDRNSRSVRKSSKAISFPLNFPHNCFSSITDRLIDLSITGSYL